MSNTLTSPLLGEQGGWRMAAPFAWQHESCEAAAWLPQEQLARGSAWFLASGKWQPMQGAAAAAVQAAACLQFISHKLNDQSFCFFVS